MLHRAQVSCAMKIQCGQTNTQALEEDVFALAFRLVLNTTQALEDDMPPLGLWLVLSKCRRLWCCRRIGRQSQRSWSRQDHLLMQGRTGWYMIRHPLPLPQRHTCCTDACGTTACRGAR